MPTYVERDAVEVVVAAQWARVLGSPPNSLDTNFFDAGGNSLRAARLTSALRTAFDVELPLQVVFDAQTFRAISECLRQGTPPAARRLVTLNGQGDGIPLVLLPSGGGGVIGLQPLGDKPINRPVHGLQALGLNPADGAPLTRLDDMVTDFARVMKESELPRTVHLAGYCSGGVFAYELARVLRESGWNVVSVTLLNTSLLTPPLVLEEVIDDRLKSIARSAGLNLGPGTLDAHQVFEALRNHGVDIVEADFTAFEARLRVFGSLWLAIVGYVPSPLDIPVRLFSTADRLDPDDLVQMSQQVDDWTEMGLKDFRCHDVPVGHYEMLRHQPTLMAIEASLAELDLSVRRTEV
ncbi:thioesterase domain-containing protein [Streptomyces sp. NPDC054794]